MKILVVGNGGREHALLWKLRRDAPSAGFFATRPNPGMARLAESVDLAPDDVEGIASWAEGNEVTLTVIGPEVPLALGLSNALRKRGLAAFGPSAAAARIESSKAFAKDLMTKVGVPTADYRTFTRWPAAESYISSVGGPLVVKASGLAAGKGALVCPTTAEALEAARTILEVRAFGEAGAEIVVEEFLDGEELSLFGITDGRHVVLLLPSQDYKRIGEDDTGSNTGGMGSYAPVSTVTSEILAEARDRIFLPVLDAMESAGTPFCGLLYAGLIVTEEGLKVIEFNCRFGDPETQAILPLMQSSLLDLLLPVGRGGSIEGATCMWREGTALNTVLASSGYPADYEKGKEIVIPPEIEEREDLLVFHAGTREEEGRLLTDGGRVLSVVGLGPDLEQARERSLEGADLIQFEGKTFRRDIGWRGFVSRARATGS
jgi:phosphoribosylamine--glycine ligase